MLVNELPLAIFLMGPTGTGKTALAVRLREDLPCEIISVDSALVYRGMNIGTAKPDKALLAKAPHRLIDICEPTGVYSAADFRQDALREMAAISAAGKIPLLVGGTGLYFRALEQGLSTLPAAQAGIRASITATAKQHGWAYLHDYLAHIDPVTAERLHPNDAQRIQRALEIYEASGRTMTDWLAEDTKASLPYKIIKLVLFPMERDMLYEYLGERFRTMLIEGLVDELRDLIRTHPLHPDLPAMRLVGYRQVWEYVTGRHSFDEMQDFAITATRQLAKRQVTWLRKEHNAVLFDYQDRNLRGNILMYLNQYPMLLSH
jgi:tRNA dimethylallyltransferase